MVAEGFIGRTKNAIIQHTSLQTTQFNGKKEKLKKWTYKTNYITW